MENENPRHQPSIMIHFVSYIADLQVTRVVAKSICLGCVTCRTVVARTMRCRLAISELGIIPRLSTDATVAIEFGIRVLVTRETIIQGLRILITTRLTS